MDKKLEILLVEDDQNACNELIQEIENNPDDFKLIGLTNNSSRAFQYITENFPDAVILDLELHHGGGDGLEFLKRIKESNLTKKPFILITTNNISSVTHKIARELGADFIMTKNQDGYSAKSVLDILNLAKSIILRDKNRAQSDANAETPTQAAKRLHRRICSELDKIGISARTLGYTYFIDAITMAIKEQMHNICERLGEKYHKSATSVNRAMQNAIDSAWSRWNTDELLSNYTAKIQSDKGVPTVTEFICYYAQKIKNDF